MTTAATATSSRLPVGVPGRLSIAPGESADCIIQAVGLEDALAQLDPTTSAALDGQLVTLRFRLEEAGVEDFETPVCVELKSDARALLSFQIPDQRAVRTLNDVAFARYRDQDPTRRHFDHRRADELYASLRVAARRFFEERLPQIPPHAKSYLSLRAENATEVSVQQDVFDAVQETQRVMSSVTQSFLERFEAGMDELWRGEAPDGEGREIPEELSLVDTGSFNDWLLTVKIIERARRRFKETESVLRARVGRLLRAAVELSQLPFGLEATSSAYHDALQNLGATRETRQALLVGFETKIVAELASLQRELIGALEAAGLGGEPDKPTIVRSRPVRARPRVGEQGAPRAAPEARQASPAHGRPKPTAPAAAPPTGPGEGATLSGTGAYETVWNLVNLARGPASGRVPAAAASRSGTPSPAGVEELIGALSALQSEQVVAPRAGGPLALLTRIGEYLPEPEALSGERRDVLELVADLIEAMLADPLVHHEVKVRLRHLAPALCKGALEGDPFFDDPRHPARLLVDAMAALRPRPDDRQGLMAALDRAIAPILEAERPPRETYFEAHAEVLPLAEDEAAKTNAARDSVAKRYRAQQAAMRALARPEKTAKRGVAEQRLEPTDWGRYLRRAEQLQTGEVLIFDADSAAPRPATLGWRSADRQTFVFVDHTTRDASSLTRQQLAMDLRRGSLHKADGASMGLTERALCRQLYALHRRVHHSATRDTLTGLVNKKHFESEVADALRRASRSFDPDYLCLVEMDRFADIVATCGRQATKALLRKLAAMLERVVGGAGVCCRVKAHRFAVLVTAGDPQEAHGLMTRFHRAVQESRCVFKGKPFPLTVSVGLGPLSADLVDVGSAMQRVERALGTAIAKGGNRLDRAVAPEALSGKPSGGDVPSVVSLIAEHRLALRAQRVQPIGAAAEGVLPYYEILLGVRKPDGSLAPPGRLIAAAESDGEIRALDCWVVRTAFDWISERPERVELVSGYAINLSGVSLGDEELLPYVLAELERTGVPPEKVIFEVTETAGIASLPVAQTFVSTLRSRGCRFSLDDFGAGHASFAYLRSLPVDKIKIDGMFVKDIETNPNDHAMVRSIVEVARFMGRQTVAEFVENEKILRMLIEIGVDYAQGYGVEKPRPIDEIVLGGEPESLPNAPASANA